MLVDEFQFEPGYWRTMPYREFLAWQRLALVRAINRKNRERS